MKKLKMARGVTLTFEEGCNKYLENCRQRNLRDGTIDHYRQMPPLQKGDLFCLLYKKKLKPPSPKSKSVDF